MRSKAKVASVAVGVLTLLSWGRTAIAGERATMTGRAPAGQAVSFSVYLPLQHREELEKALADLQNPASGSYHKWMSPAQFEARFGPGASSMKAVGQELAAYGLTARQTSAHRLEVTGEARSVERAFGTELQVGHFASGRQAVAATTALTKPRALLEANAVVAGLSGRIRMQVHSRLVPMSAPDNRTSAKGPYWFDDLKQAYGYPSVLAYDGTGTTIGILMSGDYQASDMALYFGHEKLAVPKISEVKVQGGAVYDPINGGSAETHLDIQQSGGMAPKASIVLYNLPDLSDDSFIAGLEQIIEDNKTDVVNMSFGAPELEYAPEYNDGMDMTELLLVEDDLMAQGNAQGITFVAASGDSGAPSIPPIGCLAPGATSACGAMLPSVSAPASSPHVTGVGGTNLTTTYTGSATNLNSAYVSEEAYADALPSDIYFGTPATGVFFGSGGGDSTVFSKPVFQLLVRTGNARFRTVPDVALHMGGCPAAPVKYNCNAADSFDLEVFSGKLYGVIGTSASAPDFAGLTALAVQRFGTRLGNENFYLYALAAVQAAGLPVGVFRQGIPGFNGLYSSGNRGYNRVLGNGTLRGTEFLLAPMAPTAGIPQTVSNP